jgi:ABC-type sugar transport system ATPase subunit
MPRNLWKGERGGAGKSPAASAVDSRSVDLTQPVVQCVNVTKTFGGVHALREVSLNLLPGRITALVGDNGAGKSTLVKVIGGMYAPDLGHLTVDGKVTSNLSPKHASNQGIEVVYQDLALCDNLPTEANIVLGREPHRNIFGLKILDERQAKRVGRERLEALGARIPDWDVPVRRLSGGQRQAIAIARATISGHRLIVLDEPTAALGVSQTEATLQLLRNMVKQNVAIMLIMHNLDQVFEISDHIVVLRLGQVTLDTPKSATTKRQIVAHMTGIGIEDEEQPHQ